MSAVTVFGGTGFLGKRAVRWLRAKGLTVRVAARHPEKIEELFRSEAGIVPLPADIRDADAVDRAVHGAQGVVNAVSLYVESGDLTFDAIHVDGARIVAEACYKRGVERLVHLSGIGADPNASSSYVRSRAYGEVATRQTFPNASIIRPSAMFGEDDALISGLESISRMSPIIPLFGAGRVKLQPVSVDDVAQAIAIILSMPKLPPMLYEFGGPEPMDFAELVRKVLDHEKRRRLSVPVPVFLWRLLAFGGRLLPTPPVTEGQVALLSRDNVPGDEYPGFAELGIEPVSLDRFLKAKPT